MPGRQFPGLAGAVGGTLGENLRREQFIDPEKLEFDRVAARLRRRIHEGKRAGEVLRVIAGRFGDEGYGHGSNGEGALTPF